jgi:hypothetical protein
MRKKSLVLESTLCEVKLNLVSGDTHDTFWDVDFTSQNYFPTLLLQPHFLSSLGMILHESNPEAGKGWSTFRPYIMVLTAIFCHVA